MAKSKPAAKPPAKGKTAKKFTWHKGDIVITPNGKLPPGSKPIKAPTPKPAAAAASNT